MEHDLGSLYFSNKTNDEIGKKYGLYNWSLASVSGIFLIYIFKNETILKIEKVRPLLFA